MKSNLIITAVISALMFGGCSSVSKHQESPNPKAPLQKTLDGWQAMQPLHNMYEYLLVDVRGNTPKLVELTSDDGGLTDYDIVFIGENHRHPGNHLAQANIYQRLLDSGDKVILSMEQFERDTQPTLDAYLAGEIGEWSLRHFARAWDNYQSSYRPLVEMAKVRNLPVVAANAPKDTVICTGRNGLDILQNLPDKRKADVAASFHTPKHGAYFDKYTGAMSHNGTVSERTLNSYYAQVVRDDTMAESIVNAMNANPGFKLVHLNGHFHSASGLGTVERVKLRSKSNIAVIQPILVKDPQHPQFDKADIAKGDYLLLIYPLSPEVITDENKQAWRKTVFKKSNPDCNFGGE